MNETRRYDEEDLQGRSDARSWLCCALCADAWRRCVHGGAGAGCGAAEQGERQTVEALFVSDIHFEPFWDPGKAERLEAAPVGEWSAILAEPATADREARFAELQQTCPARGADTPEALYESSLRAIRDDASGAKFVVLSGDLISHDFSCKFTTLVPKAGPGEYRAFVEKTIEYVMRELRGALPGVPVYAALGNNDSDCGDYSLMRTARFWRRRARLWRADVRGAAAGDGDADVCRRRVLQREAASAAGAHADAGAGRSVHVAAV